MAKELKPNNPFLDDDVDDFEFLNHPQQGHSGYILENENFTKDQNDWESKKMKLLEERRLIEERTLQSTNNSLGLLYESEQVGILTAEELMKQREQLDRVEENLDIINSTMRTSQKHINSLKSIFGGIKNYFSRNNMADSSLKPYVDSQEKQSTSNLLTTVDNLKSESKIHEITHPALRIRDISYDENDSYDFEGAKNNHKSATSTIFATADIEEKLDKNLENMTLGLGRLKNLALGLNEEIVQQNDKIDLIHSKADKADETLEYQNRQIKRILKK